jgi:hypothetical protein
MSLDTTGIVVDDVGGAVGAAVVGEGFVVATVAGVVVAATVVSGGDELVVVAIASDVVVDASCDRISRVHPAITTVSTPSASARCRFMPTDCDRCAHAIFGDRSGAGVYAFAARTEGR